MKKLLIAINLHRIFAEKKKNISIELQEAANVPIAE